MPNYSVFYRLARHLSLIDAQISNSQLGVSIQKPDPIIFSLGDIHDFFLENSLLKTGCISLNPNLIETRKISRKENNEKNREKKWKEKI